MSAQNRDCARPIPCDADRWQALHHEPAYDEGCVVCVRMCLLGLPLLGGSIKLGARRGRRSVRLRRGFINVERAPFGGEKLRIPSLLFVEKMRTQSRFNVRLVCVY